MDWIFNDKPVEPGIYAILYTWSPREGFFSKGNAWNGANWQETYPVVAYAGPFPSDEEATIWADDHPVD